MTTVRLAWGGPPDALAKGLAPQNDESRHPALLVSYVYLEKFMQQRARYGFTDWCMDSGAFSAFNSGATIDLVEYAETCKRMLASDSQLTEVFALDVIGDWRASEKNTQKLWALGVPAIPVYHPEEPWDVLEGLASDYPKVGIGGVATRLRGRAAKLRFYEQVFARVWPKKLHGLGLNDEAIMMRLPFHSVDAPSWELGPCGFGMWKSLGGWLPIRGGQHQLRPEVEYHLRMEDRLRTRWASEMEQLEAM